MFYFLCVHFWFLCLSSPDGQFSLLEDNYNPPHLSGIALKFVYARQRKRHRCIDKTFGLYGRRRGWDDLREQHRNLYIIKCETDRQSRLDAGDKCSGLVHWDDPEGWDGEEGGRGNTCKSMADSRQCGKNHYNIVK